MDLSFTEDRSQVFRKVMECYGYPEAIIKKELFNTELFESLECSKGAAWDKKIRI